MWLRLSLLAGLCASTVHAADWPQWLGPQRNGASVEAIEPWTEAPKVLWKADVGPGFSAPVIAAGKVFVHARVPDHEREEMIAFDAATGAELWRTAYDRTAYASVLNTGPQATPTVAGGRVYGFGITGVLSCFDAETGQSVWQVDTSDKLKAERPTYGVCCSPLVIGNRVIVAVQTEDASVFAFDAASGEVAWSALDEPANTSSPILFTTSQSAVPDAVFMTSLRVVGLNPLDGAISWAYPLPFQPSGTAPTPIATPDSIITSTMDNGTTSIRLAANDTDSEAAQPTLTWQRKELSGYFSTGLATSDRLFLVTNTLKPLPRADLACVELATGKSIWKQNGVGYFHFGAVRTTNDRLLILNDAGKAKLVDASGAEYSELCTADVCNGTLVAPAFSDGRLYARDATKIVCVGLVP